tara:strand:+ start:279 stop:419 length:141 start_codon:yes stop_codon:yes gene_type:complete
MKRYYVEWICNVNQDTTKFVYVKAYNQEQIKDMFDEYELVAIDITE